jgi:hypothetical protein
MDDVGFLLEIHNSKGYYCNYRWYSQSENYLKGIYSFFQKVSDIDRKEQKILYDEAKRKGYIK